MPRNGRWVVWVAVSSASWPTLAAGKGTVPAEAHCNGRNGFIPHRANFPCEADTERRLAAELTTQSARPDTAPEQSLQRTHMVKITYYHMFNFSSCKARRSSSAVARPDRLANMSTLCAASTSQLTFGLWDRTP